MLFEGCHVPTSSGWRQWCWPDGRSLLEQPQPRVQALSLIRNEANATMAQKLESERKRHGT